MNTFTVINARYDLQGEKPRLFVTLRIQRDGTYCEMEDDCGINPGVRYCDFLKSVGMYDEDRVRRRELIEPKQLIGLSGCCEIDTTGSQVLVHDKH